MVLAGGASRRLGGRPKGLEVVGGVRILDRVVNAISAVTPVALIASNDPLASTWLDDVSVVADVYPGSGGLSGVHAALSIGNDVLVVAWDMPFVPPELLRLIIHRAHESHAAIVVPESSGPTGVEPFCGYYSRASLPLIDQFLKTGGGPAHDFLQGVPGSMRVPSSEIRRLGDLDRMFFSVNTPEDLAQARAIAAGSQ